MTTKHLRYVIEEEDPTIEYPDTDGEPMAEDDAQLTAMIDAISSLREWFDTREDVYVGGDMLMYYRMNDNETRVAPDVFVVLGVASREKRRNWIVWREGRPPDFVMEVASGSTWRHDMRRKRDIYAEMEVAEYWRFDPVGSYLPATLIGERLVDGEYREIALETDANGILRGHSAVLGLDLCVLPDGNLHFYDPAGEQWLLTPHEQAQARQAAETALRAESAARRTAEAARQAAEAARQAVEDENRRLRERLQQLESGQ